ncbi:MAG TPA: DsbE family thiol:disulfide interchange protein [Steroidobacteraceae bacterium]|nr:DsbE family thiol:disulfide interchange protein [Steroidobacteraceae bacterium]
MWKYLLPSVAFLGLIVLFALGLNQKRDINYLPSPLIGKPAPQFTLSDVLEPNRTVSNRALRGHVYLFNVWATWCAACREEQHALLEIAQQHVVPILGLDWNDQRSRAQEWLRDLGNPYQGVGFDENGRVAINWGVYGAPETYLIDRQGRILFKHIAPMTMQVWNKQFLPRIAAARRGGA